MAAMGTPPLLQTNGYDNMGPGDDPFLINPEDHQSHTHSHRYAAFDTQVFSLNASASPSQAKRAVEAHIAETNRRLEGASRLGSALVQQRTELAEKLKEIEKRKDDAELPPELRDRLQEIEKDYNDVGRETARALLAPRSRVVSADERPVDEGTAVFSSQANASPSKVSVPSRKQRNQPTSRAGDIQFAADISTSLLVQVRQLQAALSEREISLKEANLERSKLETEAEGFSQRLRAMDESEQRFKDENWNLETQNHEMTSTAKDAADREKRIAANLAAALSEKNRAQNDLDEVRLAHVKLGEDHSAARKLHDSELHSLKRNIDIFEGERDFLQRKVDALTSQNHELAKAITARSRTREDEGEDVSALQDDDDMGDSITPEPSPPPSPTKATPRHGALESETLKSSLHHAHRMIQNLKGNIHREKTEKVELKRMLQDARDELENRRSESGTQNSGSKRQKIKEVFKKTARPDMLGGSRRARTDVEIEEPDWEDHAADASPSRGSAAVRGVTSSAGNRTDMSDAYQTANETEGAFETANERESTESEDFQTGAESMAGDSTDGGTETETEGGIDRKGTVRASRPAALGSTNNKRNSYMSTASTSADEEDRAGRLSAQPHPARYRLKMGRIASARQSRVQTDNSSRETTVSAHGSPANLGSSPAPQEQSLFAELGDFNGGGSEFGTPGKTSVFSSSSTPAATPFSERKSLRSVETVSQSSEARIMVDSATMTEPWAPPSSSRTRLIPSLNLGAATSPTSGNITPDLPPPSPSDFPLPPSLPTSPVKPEANYTPLRGVQESPNRGPLNFITPPKTVWDEAQDQNDTDVRDQFASSPPVPTFAFSNTSPQRPEAGYDAQPSPVPAFSFSQIITQETVPVEAPYAKKIEPHAAAVERKKSSGSIGEKVAEGAAVGIGAGILGTVGAAFGFGRSKPSEIVVAEDKTTSGLEDTSSETALVKQPLQDISGNAAPVKYEQLEAADKSTSAAPTSSNAAESILTAEEIEEALRRRYEQKQASSSSPPPLVRPTVSAGAIRPPSRGKNPVSDPDVPPSPSPSKRTVAIPALQTGSAIHHPPLPADHKNAIAKAGGRMSPSSPLPDPAQQAAASGAGNMGPPVAPASAYRRPHTPGNQGISSPIRGSTTPRAGRGRPGTGTTSHMSRRSSVSSFASELDERFNIRTDGLPMHRTFEAGPGTDPRMIQAITQTMIGEYLWKYTRKAGRPEMSNTRHRRYFWVHPYTRTLYWSDTDPQNAGGKERKAKSVAIESVRVVADDNPIPPWLHRKSLEIVTPGRKVKFTAETSSRHETWFNALSYLLMRSEDDPTGRGAADDSGLTADDVDEFNPGNQHRSSRMTGGSRVSLSSYNSTATRGTAFARPSLKAPTNSSSRPPMSASSMTALPSNNPDHDPNRTLRRGSVSRFSSMFRPSSIRGSLSRRSVRDSAMSGVTDGTLRPNTSSGQRGGGGSIYDASVVSDGRMGSVEELRRELSKHERESDGRLENVRACCDGKHDVSDLANAGSHIRHTHSTASTSTRHRSRDRLAASISSRVR